MNQGQWTTSPSLSMLPKCWRGVETHMALQRLRTQAENQSILLDAEVQERTKEMTGFAESLDRKIMQREKADKALEERLRFESLLSDVSARFVRVPADRLDGEILNNA